MLFGHGTTRKVTTYPSLSRMTAAGLQCWIPTTGCERQLLPVEAVHHLEVRAQVFLGQVVKHAGVHQTLHEVAAVLRQAQAGQPLIPNPLVIHVSVRQRLQPDTRFREAPAQFFLVFISHLADLLVFLNSALWRV